MAFWEGWDNSISEDMLTSSAIMLLPCLFRSELPLVYIGSWKVSGLVWLLLSDCKFLHPSFENELLIFTGLLLSRRTSCIKRIGKKRWMMRKLEMLLDSGVTFAVADPCLIAVYMERRKFFDFCFYSRLFIPKHPYKMYCFSRHDPVQDLCQRYFHWMSWEWLIDWFAVVFFVDLDSWKYWSGSPDSGEIISYSFLIRITESR